MLRFRAPLALVAMVAALAAVLVFAVADAQARVGGKASLGSRGSRTFSMPAQTPTAPNAAQPMQRTVTPNAPSRTAGSAATAPARPGLFGGGMLGGIAAGFLGAGLFGMLFGNGFLGGMGGFASVLGLMFQVVAIVFIARLLIGWFTRNRGPAFAAANGGQPQQGLSRNFLGGLGGSFGNTFGGGNGAPQGVPQGEPVTIDKADYDAFEDLLGNIQTAYSNEDLSALRADVTPEMLSYFSEDLTTNASRGVVNRVTDVKLLQGDLAEAWRDGGNDYATVAMRFSLVDRLVDRASGRTVEGGDAPQEATELWTFVRSRGGRRWLLSAIQQS